MDGANNAHDVNGRLAGSPMSRRSVAGLSASKVREVANAGFGRSDLAKFWFGESDQPTPRYLRDAAKRALDAGHTFYAHNHGSSELRAALGDYLSRRHRARFNDDRLAVTSSGVSALMIAMQALLDPGDRVVIVTPIWPNVAEIPKILGAEVVRIGLHPAEGRWQLDLDRLLEAITADTRLVIFNSPGNPTGWVLPDEDRTPILERCRRVGAWLLTDDVYERLMLDGTEDAPSFLPLIDEQDRVIGANSFSKAWLMTGWRLGWLVAPTSLHADLGKLIEYNTSCAPEFVQAAGVVALKDGEPHVAALRAELARKRDTMLAALQAIPGLEVTRPQGGMYVLLRDPREPDSVAFAKRLVAEHGLGLAPGAAFGPESEGWLRWCIAVADDALEEGIRRLHRAVAPL